MNNKIQISLVAVIALTVGIAGTFSLMYNAETITQTPQIDVQEELIQKQTEIERLQTMIEKIYSEDPIERVIPATNFSYSVMGIDERASSTDYVVIGTIQKTDPIIVYRDFSDRIEVHTIVTMNVNEDVCGNYPLDRIQFRIFGGSIVGYTMEFPDLPQFQKGDEYLFFIQQGTEGIGFFGDELYVSSPGSVWEYSEDMIDISAHGHGKSGDRETVLDTIHDNCKSIDESSGYISPGLPGH